MNRELTEYIKNFLTDTLGIHSILANAAENTSMHMFLVEDLQSYNADESELLDKMIAALKLNGEYKILDLKSSSVSAREDSLKVIFKNSPQHETEIYSPRALLQRPELKRKAWDDLKRIFSIQTLQ